MTFVPDSNTVGNVNVSSGASNTVLVPVRRKQKSSYVGWEGVYRLKDHVANIHGNVAPCWKASKDNQLRCRQVIMDVKNKKKKNKKKEEEKVRATVSIGSEEDLEEIKGLGLRKTPMILGPMDIFDNLINPDSSVFGKTMKQQSLNDTNLKERTHVIERYVAKWVYQVGIPFNAIDNDCFLQMVEAIGRFGLSFKPQSQ
ncbi:hypothetical protein EZV62_018206 [Acer yangbiense]|uniref:Uncharacterized protein n=1 Tax=Acer yangbiense TaxID=1000413 RepID=A0A5C7HIM8_9ROSI|nr:hypothetical protein EZV62_018206 [Acer yangbiense]